MKRLLTVLGLLALVAGSAAGADRFDGVEAVPVSHFAERQSVGTQHRMTIYSAPLYYRDVQGKWARTRERFAAGANGYVAEAVEGVHRARVRADGTIRMEHLDGAIVQRITGIAAVMAAGNTSKIWPVDLSAWARVVDGNRVAWTHPTGYTYEVVYVADSLVTRLTIPQSAFAALKGFLPGGAVAFGPVQDWDESGLGEGWTCDKPDDSDGTESIRYLKGGRVKQSVRAARVNWQDHEHPGWAKRRIRSKVGKSLVEAIPSAALDGTAAIVFNDTVSYQEGVSGYSGCIDNSLYEGSKDANYGNETYLATRAPGTTQQYNALLSFNLPDLGAVTVTDASLTLVCYTSSGTSTISAYRALKPWEETDSSWNQWDKSGGKEWGAAGAMHTSDTDAENIADGPVGGDDADRRATAAFAEAAQTGTGAKTLGSGQAGFIALAQAWLDATATDTYGIVLLCAGATTYQFYRSSEYATAAERPKLTIVYTAGGVPLPVLLHHYRQQGSM